MSKTNRSSHNWKFSKIGGITRVLIESGADIAHLGELDQKLWTALSCPTSGFEFDEKTLAYLDSNNDGRIHVNEVVEASRWLTAIVKDPDSLLRGEDFISPEDINPETEEGKAILAGISNLRRAKGVESGPTAVADTASALEALAAEAAEARAAGEDVLPYGENTEEVMQLIGRLKSKIDDYFLRSRLAAYDTASMAALDVSAERIGAISEKELPGCIDEIATYPLARVDGSQALPLSSVINPAWAADFARLRETAMERDYPGAEAFTEQQWQEIQGKIATYAAWKDEVKKEEDEFLESRRAEAETIIGVDKFLHLYRDFFRFLQNFVAFSDFYSRDESRLAVFQSGKLFIDERCLDLCVRVTDMARHGDMSAKSGMFILYCHCVSKVKGAEMEIAGIVTEGNTRSLSVGQNAIFYDRDGHDWDATVVKIVDNPISVPQAFWSPYRKFGKWCADKLNRGAEERDEKATGDLVAKADGAKVPEDGAAGKKQAFDIAKFAGIFAAIGMALGFILDALVGLLDSIIKMPWWGFFVLIAAIILIISGPSMLLAWIKLRKRNLAPVLNANGWAINSRVLVNTQFGSTLTHLAEYPRVKGKDPFKKKTPLWRKILRWFLLLLLLAVVAFWICNKRLPWQKPHIEEIMIEEVVTEGTTEGEGETEEFTDAAAEPPADGSEG